VAAANRQPHHSSLITHHSSLIALQHFQQFDFKDQIGVRFLWAPSSRSP